MGVCVRVGTTRVWVCMHVCVRVGTMADRYVLRFGTGWACVRVHLCACMRARMHIHLGVKDSKDRVCVCV